MSTSTHTGCTSCSATATPLQRPRFFARQTVTPTELNLAGDYARRRLQLHNRYLHGFGVVCGALVEPVGGDDGAWKVRIGEGLVIDGDGNDVLLPGGRVVDVRRGGGTGTAADPCGEPADPWCAPAPDPDPGAGSFLAVRYREVPTRMVTPQPGGCGCGGTTCEYSRWCDGYEIALLDACPPSHQGVPPSPGGILTGTAAAVPDCPPCPDGGWVVLAVLTTDEHGAVTVDNHACRRMVFSLAPYWWRSAPDAPPAAAPVVTAVAVDPPAYGPGDGVTLTVTGSGFVTGASALLGSRVTVQAVTVTDATTLTITAKIWVNAKGAYALTVKNPAGTASVPFPALAVS